MARLLFLFHGMGVHDGGWSQEVTAKLDDVASRYPYFSGKKLSQQVQWVPVGYDQVFNTQRAAWGQAADALEAGLLAQGISATRLIGWLTTASQTERAFFWTHAVDVLLYRFFEQIRREVIARVLEQIATALEAAMQGGEIAQASVLAHNLGTSVAHDCLAYLGSQPIAGSSAYLADNFQFANVFMLANVSRILQTDRRADQSVVRPASAPPPGYCDRYYNFRHAFDPIPAVQAFTPGGWGADYRTETGLRHFIERYRYNVHGYTHYLDHPKVHIPLIRGLLGAVIPEPEAQAAIAGYADVQVTKPCLVALQHQLEALKESFEASDDPLDLVIASAKSLAAIKEAADACG